jgi:excisionase family DNA binding protein
MKDVQESDHESDYLTPGEVALLYHVSPRTISRWANQGLLPCLVTLGGHRRFRRHDVEEIARRTAANR